MLARAVLPEILDHLPSDDPAAMRSRRDLRRINQLMGNERWICRAVGRLDPAIVHRGIAELGAGEGILTRRLARQFPNAPVTAYDLAPRPPALEPRIGWQCGDLFESPSPTTGGVAIANLFLHHFEGNDLLRLGTWFSDADAVVFCEPDRARLPHVLGRLMHPWINHVTRHDMHVSITAGFYTGELPEMLGMAGGDWQFRESSTWRGARRVIGCRT